MDIILSLPLKKLGFSGELNSLPTITDNRNRSGMRTQVWLLSQRHATISINACCHLLLLLLLLDFSHCFTRLGKWGVWAGHLRSSRHQELHRKRRPQLGRTLPSWEKQGRLGQQKRKTHCMGWRKLRETGAELTPHFLVTDCLQANSSAEPARVESLASRFPCGLKRLGSLLLEHGCSEKEEGEKQQAKAHSRIPSRS